MNTPVSFTTPGSPNRDNEDLALATSEAMVLLDGAGGPATLDNGCRHGTPWFVRQLATTLHQTMTSRPRHESAPLLAEAINTVAALHPDCDLTHPGTPSTTVVLLRQQSHGGAWDYLVLSDSTLIIEPPGAGLLVVSDQRIDTIALAERQEMERHPIGSQEHYAARVAKVQVERTWRNRPGGHWIAATDPRVAAEALTGTVPGLARASLLSDGAARWLGFTGKDEHALLDALDRHGPAELIGHVRACEDQDPEGRQLPRAKKADDATIIYHDPMLETRS